MGRTHVGEVCGELSPVGGTLCWSREQCEEEGAAGTMCDELIATLITRPPVPLWRKEGEKWDRR